MDYIIHPVTYTLGIIISQKIICAILQYYSAKNILLYLMILYHEKADEIKKKMD